MHNRDERLIVSHQIVIRYSASLHTMNAVPSETAISPGPPAPLSRLRINRHVGIPGLVIFVLIAIVLVLYTTRTQLSAKERMLLGAWQWQGDKPGTMVLYFDDRGILTYSQPPYTAFHFERWHIDENDRIHLTHDGKDIFRTISRLVVPKTDVHLLRFSNGSPIFTLPNGTEKVLVPYTGTATATLKNAR